MGQNSDINKVLWSCRDDQDYRSCSLDVRKRVFGTDPKQFHIIINLTVFLRVRLMIGAIEPFSNYLYLFFLSSC